MRKIALVCSTIGAMIIPFQAITMESNWNYQKVVDTELRKVYYSECKANNGKKCHMTSFEKSVKLIIK